jgi:hypothetical protein
MSISPRTLFLTLLLQSAVAGSGLAQTTQIPVSEQRQPILLDQLGAEAQKQYAGEGIDITPFAGGARLRAALQDLEGEATNEGLWLSSTADEDAGKLNRFRVRAVEVGRGGSEVRGQKSEVRGNKLAQVGVARVSGNGASYVRPSLIEEYSVSTDGVRQDFVVMQRPAGASHLQVMLEVSGARAEAASYGAKLTAAATGRELAYSRLRVTDATGRELQARMNVDAADRLRVEVEDAGAVYPVRIDPTFSDADWVSMNAQNPGVNGDVLALAMDGSGNLYIGGFFTFVVTVPANNVAKWNGSAWSALGTGTTGPGLVRALAVNGTDVYVGGDFSSAGGVANTDSIAKWDGNAWSALGTGIPGSVFGLAVSGTNVYAAGQFSAAGGVTNARCIARWNGTAWSALGTGIPGGANAVAVIGSNVYVGGRFPSAGGVTASCIARWNGSSWSPLSTGMNASSAISSVNALAVIGTDLYAGGSFETAGGVTVNNIARWDGSNWHALGTGTAGTNPDVHALAVSGTTLYAAGEFTDAGGNIARRVAAWNGSAWSGLAGGVGTTTDGVVWALAASGTNLYAGGDFQAAASVFADGIVKWDGSAWSAFGTGMNGPVHAVAVMGTDLYVGGEFTSVGQAFPNTRRVARWNGSTWSGLESGADDTVYAMAVIGSDLYIGGEFTNVGSSFTTESCIARWNGVTWFPVGAIHNSPVAPVVNALTVSGTDLYVGGRFYSVHQPSQGSVTVHCVAKWDGSLWSHPTPGVDSSTGTVNAVAVQGTDVYIGGSFSSVGPFFETFAAKNIVKWNGTEWSTLGQGTESAVYALVFAGSDLYAGGFFDAADGVADTTGIARWDGSAWHPLGTGLSHNTGSAGVYRMVTRGTDLFVGGVFHSAGGVSASNLAKWNGSRWTPLGAGTSGAVRALAFDNANHMFAGGYFQTVAGGAIVSPYLAMANVGESEIAVEQPADDDLISGSATVGFDNAMIGITTTQKVFTIKNSAAVGLNIAGIVTTGAENGDFLVNSTGTDFSLAAGGSTTFVVTFGPTGAGDRSTTLQVISDDTDEGTFAIELTGSGISPLHGTLAFQSAEIAVNEAATTIQVPIARTGGSDGPVSVRVNSATGTADGTDFNAVSNDLVNFAEGETSKTVGVTILNDALVETNETFALELSDPQGGATFGTQQSVTIRILEPDSTAPAVALSAPGQGSLHNISLGTLIDVTGTATDDTGVKQVQVSLNDAAFVDAALSPAGATSPLSTNFLLAINPRAGTNTVRVKSIDYRNNESAVATRTFTVGRSMTVNALPAASGTVTPALAGTAFRDMGKSYSVTATPNAGKIFTGWTLVGPSPQSLGMAASALEKPAINFIFREELTLTANFADNPYGASVIGTYTGLIRADGSRPDRPNAEPDGTPPGLGSEGYFTATVTNTGAFSGKLTLDGFVLNVAGIFDHQGRARFGTARAFTQTVARLNKPSYTVKFDIGGVPGSAAPVGKITGEVSATEFKKSVLAAVSTLSADRAPYTGLAGGVVPDAYLTVTGTAASPAGRTDGVFTVALPSVPLGSQPLRISSALKEGDYPKGSGVGTLKVTKGGAVTLTATLADGTAMTVSGKLSEDLRVALFAQLYNLKGFLSTELKLDTQADNDVKPAAGSVVHWSRPFSGTSHYYPLGWAQTIELELLGGKYAVTGGQSVMRAAGGVFLQAADEDGNVTLSLSDGLIEEPGLVKSANLSPGDVVTKVPDNDPTFTMKVNRATGMITGMFDHTDDTKPSYTAVILQKGPSAGAQGFFLTKQPVPIDYMGESGRVEVIGQP